MIEFKQLLPIVGNLGKVTWKSEIIHFSRNQSKKLSINSINAGLCTSRLVCQRLMPYKGPLNALSIDQPRGNRSPAISR